MHIITRTQIQRSLRAAPVTVGIIYPLPGPEPACPRRRRARPGAQPRARKTIHDRTERKHCAALPAAAWKPVLSSDRAWVLVPSLRYPRTHVFAKPGSQRRAIVCSVAFYIQGHWPPLWHGAWLRHPHLRRLRAPPQVEACAKPFIFLA